LRSENVLEAGLDHNASFNRRQTSRNVGRSSSATARLGASIAREKRILAFEAIYSLLLLDPVSFSRHMRHYFSVSKC
jgi:hypothetical protein